MAKPLTLTPKDYARKPELLEDESYLEWMKKPSFRALQWVREQKESEFKKPYREPDHVRMEAFPQWPPPWYPPFPPFPGFPDPVPDDPDSPWYPGEPGEPIIDTKCPAWAGCLPDNPQTIVAGGDAVVMNVKACGPPNSVSIKIHEDNYFKVKVQPIFMGDSWAFAILAEADACGLCTIIISCSDGSGTRCYLRCTNGVWVQKSTGVCEMSGNGTYVSESGASVYYELVDGLARQYQQSYQSHSGTYNCPSICTVDGGCNALCGDTGAGRSCANCIDPCTYTVTRCNQGFNCDCINSTTYACWANIFGNMTYEEWECP